MHTERQESKLIRNLGFWDLMAIAVGQIVGAGIMSSTGIAIGMTGTGVVLAFLLSPFLTVICIFPIAILSSAVPVTGGPYRYCSRLLGKSFGMIYLLLHTMSYSVAMSQFALSFGLYLQSIVPAINQHFAAAALLSLLYAMNLTGPKSAARLNKVISIVLFAGLGTFILFGLPKVDFSVIFNIENLFPNGPFLFISTLALLSSATAGAQFIAELGGEAKDAGRTIPRVMFFATFAVGIVYVLIALVAAGVLPIAEVANQPLTLVAQTIMPKAILYLFVIGSALGGTATALNSSLSWITKPVLVACDDGMLPRNFGTVSSRGVPYKLLTFFYIIAMLPLVFGLDITTITKFTTANSLLCKLLVCIALFVLAQQHGKILERSTLKITPENAKILSIVGILILCILSYSLFANLSAAVVVSLVLLIGFSILHSRIFCKGITLEDDLTLQ